MTKLQRTRLRLKILNVIKVHFGNVGIEFRDLLLDDLIQILELEKD